MSEELKPCPFCKEKASHGLTKGQRDMHGDLNQNYAVWCPSGHARITAADRDRAAGLWNTCADLAPTDAQIMAHQKVRALVAALNECRDELDEYSRQEYPGDHPVHERYRKRDYDSNTARLALATLEDKP